MDSCCIRNSAKKEVVFVKNVKNTVIVMIV